MKNSWLRLNLFQMFVKLHYSISSVFKTSLTLTAMLYTCVCVSIGITSSNVIFVQAQWRKPKRYMQINYYNERKENIKNSHIKDQIEKKVNNNKIHTRIFFYRTKNSKISSCAFETVFFLRGNCNGNQVFCVCFFPFSLSY